ncbi:hypothetical protein L484_005363 [Morus notabilis]|uniref:Uncharacterized protein n=1 Tax=Morus notabilis TaxID=981085 RepID=W9RVD1_9ROSA|nr:hypothetical protein L484_005363 [Morus notabilis]
MYIFISCYLKEEEGEVDFCPTGSAISKWDPKSQLNRTDPLRKKSPNCDQNKTRPPIHHVAKSPTLMMSVKRPQPSMELHLPISKENCLRVPLQ